MIRRWVNARRLNDVHQATISVAILDSAGKLVMEVILETKAERFCSLFAACVAVCM